MIDRSYERELSYRKKENDGKLRRSDGRLERIEWSALYIVLERLTIRVDGIGRPANVGMIASSTARFIS